VRAVAEAHGGSVSAGRSTYGGARFSVRLPLVALANVQEPVLDFPSDETPRRGTKPHMPRRDS
jgi:hypothetical protein